MTKELRNSVKKEVAKLDEVKVVLSSVLPETKEEYLECISSRLSSASVAYNEKFSELVIKAENETNFTNWSKAIYSDPKLISLTDNLKGIKLELSEVESMTQEEYKLAISNISEFDKDEMAYDLKINIYDLTDAVCNILTENKIDLKFTYYFVHKALGNNKVDLIDDMLHDYSSSLSESVSLAVDKFKSCSLEYKDHTDFITSIENSKLFKIEVDFYGNKSSCTVYGAKDIREAIEEYSDELTNLYRKDCMSGLNAYIYLDACTLQPGVYILTGGQSNHPIDDITSIVVYSTDENYPSSRIRTNRAETELEAIEDTMYYVDEGIDETLESVEYQLEVLCDHIVERIR